MLRSISWLGVVLVVTAAASVAQAAQVVPKEAVPGATVELRGGDVPKKGAVKVAGKNAEVVSRKKSRVRFVVPNVRAGKRSVRMGDAETTMKVLKRFRGKVGVELAKSKAERKKIGPGGGKITASHDGIKYVLEVPAGALTDPERITMTPAAKLKNLPLTRNRPAAVQLRPNGLKFRTPAELSITGLNKPGRQDGFTMSDKGRGFELVEADREGKRVVVPIEHFSTPGAGGATEQDYVNFLTQFIVSTPAILTRGQIETLLNELEIARDRFENFCVTQEVLCDAISERVFRSLRRLINQECDRQTAQPSIGGLSIILDLTVELQLFAEEEDIPVCVQDILEALAEPAIENVATAPFEHSDTAEFQLNSIALADLNQDGELAWIEWVYHLAGWAQRFGGEDLGSDLASAFATAMDKTLQDGKALCEGTDPEEGRALLERGFAIANATGYLRSDFAAALVDCGCDGTSASDASAAQADQCQAPDLAVDVSGPATAGVGAVTYTVRVENLGPRRVTGYTLHTDLDDSQLNCQRPGGEEFSESQGPLEAGEVRVREFQITCEPLGDPPRTVSLEAQVLEPIPGPDPDPSNNADKAETAMS